MNLNKLKIKEKAIIKDIQLDDQVKARMLSYGLFVGTEICLVRKAVMGDPSIYLLAGSLIAIRNKDAERIVIELRE